MIYPKKNIVFKAVLLAYVRWLTKRHFEKIHYNEISFASNKSILLIANHFSAWDTFVLYHINRKFFKKKFHFMILEQTVLKRPILSFGGAFSINKNSRDVVRSLDFAAQLLRDPDNLVLIYPQGKLYSNLITEVNFEQGITHVVKKAAGQFNMVFAATFIENFENFKAVANVYLTTESKSFTDVEALQQAYQQHYTSARQQQTQIIK